MLGLGFSERLQPSGQRHGLGSGGTRRRDPLGTRFPETQSIKFPRNYPKSLCGREAASCGGFKHNFTFCLENVLLFESLFLKYLSVRNASP